MTRNTTLTMAVMLALASAGVATAQEPAAPQAQPESQKCNDEAMELKAQIEASNLGDADRAKLGRSLSEAQGADMARCEQIVSRISRELQASGAPGIANPETGRDYGASNAGKQSTNTGEQSTSDQSS